jgi:hypothetical protein
MGRDKQRKCLNCGEVFTPDARNAHHQRYCTAPPCKAASKRASQAKWLAKPENQAYYRGPEAVARVQAWRKAHPGYSRRKAGVSAQSLPADGSAAVEETSTTTPDASAPKISCNAPPAPLQDLLEAQPVVLVGLIAHLWGSALQEDIASALTRLIQLGQDIRGGDHERDQASFEPGTPAPGARAFQLARSSSGAGALHREG